jgi:hypothetical protein
MEQAGLKLGMSTLCVSRIESRTRRIPACTRRAMTAVLNPPPSTKQISIFEYLDGIDEGRG